MSALVAHRKPVSAYRPPIRTRDLPLPPRWTPREKAIAEARLTQFVVLSMLLHALAILLFGSPSGGARDGRAMWGSLQVVIREAVRPSPAPVAPVAPIVTPTEEAPKVVPVPRVAPPPAPPAEAAPPRPAEFPPLLDRLAPSEVKIEPAVEFKVPPIETPRIPAPLLQPMPSMPERSALPPVEAPAIRVPAPTPRIPAPLLQPMPSIPERSTLPSVEMPVIRIPAEMPSIPAPLLQPLAPLPDRSMLPSIEQVPIPAEIKPQPVEIPRTPEPSRMPAPSSTLEPSTRTPEPTPRTPEPSSRTPAPPATVRDPISPFRAPPPRPEDSTYDPTKPSLDLDALRKRAGDITRQGTGNRAVLPFPMPPVEKPKSKMEQAIENARKPDCREAYKALGLAAVVPLIANEFGEGTCRW